MSARHSILIILLFLFSFSIAYAEESIDINSVHIVTYEEDLTDDGMNEMIKVEGVYLSNSSSYFHLVWATITSSTNEEWKVYFPGGFNPTIQFVDLTNNGTLDILYQSTTAQNKAMHTLSLYTIEENALVAIPLPTETFVHGRLKDNFLAHLFVTPHHSPVIIDLKEHANTYILSGIYDETGVLLHQQDIRIASVQNVQLHYNEQQSQHSLRTIQHVYAPSSIVQLGIIESEWIYRDEAWTLLESVWK